LYLLKFTNFIQFEELRKRKGQTATDTVKDSSTDSAATAPTSTTDTISPNELHKPPETQSTHNDAKTVL
jgi:hypothetical protein